jgi:hypothetical protein
MADIEQLRKDHAYARLQFEGACMAEQISLDDYIAIRDRYHATAKAYHDALGYGDPVGGEKQP